MKMSDINKIKFKLYDDVESELIDSKEKSQDKEKSDGEGVSDAESDVIIYF